MPTYDHIDLQLHHRCDYAAFVFPPCPGFFPHALTPTPAFLHAGSLYSYPTTSVPCMRTFGPLFLISYGLNRDEDATEVAGGSFFDCQILSALLLPTAIYLLFLILSSPSFSLFHLLIFLQPRAFYVLRLPKLFIC
ncbi:hypothetical protein FB45DRAFT_1025335 [Roridomyces roridus]|uniref:Uncharacterized protein n=1 Tax=Roridomyces roridus TaxID=1738132 RepID=A0AAD7B8B9_9AGAR|nr:hypothetical protein FB45DRAFT_1040947 [Roridomyces roridus]KAJ7612781.1 hypothetical protein FB45DRAFT_1036992 [Roridomyces roridus]KAJ7634384.1 hypothetical protein FB45DRAFT_1025335 [Roridomyces roridus]